MSFDSTNDPNGKYSYIKTIQRFTSYSVFKTVTLTCKSEMQGCGKKIMEEVHILLSTIAGLVFVETVVLACCGIFGWKCFFYWLEREVIMIPEDQISNIIVIEPESSSSTMSSSSSSSGSTSYGASSARYGHGTYGGSGYMNSRVLHSMQSSRGSHRRKSSRNSRRSKRSSVYDSGDRKNKGGAYNAAVKGGSAPAEVIIPSDESKKNKSNVSNGSGRSKTSDKTSGSINKVPTENLLSRIFGRGRSANDPDKSKSTSSDKSELKPKTVIVTKKSGKRRDSNDASNKGQKFETGGPSNFIGSKISNDHSRYSNASAEEYDHGGSSGFYGASKIMGSYHRGEKRQKSDNNHALHKQKQAIGGRLVGEMKVKKGEDAGKKGRGTIAVVRNKNPPPLRNIFAFNNEPEPNLAENIANLSSKKAHDAIHGAKSAHKKGKGAKASDSRSSSVGHGELMDSMMGREADKRGEHQSRGHSGGYGGESYGYDFTRES